MGLPFGINVIGYVSSNVSLGITARQFIKLFQEKGVPVAVHDIDFGRSERGRDFDFQSLVVQEGNELPYSINMFFLAVGQLPQLLLKSSPDIFSSERLNVGLLWYEVTSIPSHLAEALSRLDVLVCGSGFVKHIFDTNVRNTLTIECKHPLYLPSHIVPSREKFGLPKDCVLFICSFDPHHDPARKNPFAVIDAFLLAYPLRDEGAHLVVKLNNADVKTNSCDPESLLQQLKVRCTNDHRIHILPQSLPYLEVLSLYASCDVFVSLHRSEGLGLGPLESMLLGKPVIATAWSGNMSYMKHSNSCLVGYDLIPYSGMGADGPFQLRNKAKWAEPRVSEAADWMRVLAQDANLRREIGSKAAIDAAAYHREAQRADFLDELKHIVNEKGWLPSRTSTKWTQIDRLRQLQQAVYFAGWNGFKRHVRHELDRRVVWRLNKLLNQFRKPKL